MRIKITANSALVDEAKGTRAGLAETVTVSKDRGEYLISIGAAEKVGDDEKKPAAETETPQNNGGEAAGTSTDEKKAAPTPRRPAPKVK